MWWLCTAILVLGAFAAGAFWKERQWRRRHQQHRLDFATRLEQLQQDFAHDAQVQQRALFDSMTDVVMLLNENGKIVLLNESLRSLFGLSATAGPGQSILETFRLPVLQEISTRLRKEPTVAGVELHLSKPLARDIEVNASAIHDRERAYRGAIYVFHDFTRVKELESTRKEFVANVSHELRTPLSLIKGFVETLLDGAQEDPEMVTRYLKTIQRHTDRLTYLIEDLLTLSQLEAGHVMLNFEPVSLREIVDGIQSDLRSKATEKEVTVSNELPPNSFVRADADRIEQVLFNLIDNGIKYGRAGGKVRVGLDEREQEVEVWVKDDGLGIPAEAQTRIFERFYRVDRARSRETGGTGLGLAIVKHIVFAHGGNVWVESDLGHGSTFRFTLPLRPTQNDNEARVCRSSSPAK